MQRRPSVSSRATLSRRTIKIHTTALSPAPRLINVVIMRLKKAKKAKQNHKPPPSKRASQNSNESTPAATRPKRPTSGSPVFFSKDGEAPYGFLCQWYRCRFTDPESGLEFSCAEQWIMWSKAQLAGDLSTAKVIITTSSPRKHKQLGRRWQDLILTRGLP